jgi:hypothetical protein
MAPSLARVPVAKGKAGAEVVAAAPPLADKTRSCPKPGADRGSPRGQPARGGGCDRACISPE